MSSIRDYAKEISDYADRHNLMDGDVAFFQRLVREALRDERDAAFDQGYVCAVANILNLHGEEVIAREVLNANRPKDWSIIDPLDRKALQPIFDHEAAQAEIQKLQVGHDSKTL